MQGKVSLKGAEMLIYLHILESRFCDTVLYFLYKSATQILCRTLALLKLLMSAQARGPAVQVTTQPCPQRAWGTCDTLGSAGGRATVLLAPSLNNLLPHNKNFTFILLVHL